MPKKVSYGRCLIVPWIMALIRDLGTERASKEREEERADMTAHLHDGVLQTLALIQLHADDQQTVFSLARSQERELREWLYQERTTSDRSVNAGLKEIAAHVEDTHGKPIEVVTVGDARPSAYQCGSAWRRADFRLLRSKQQTCGSVRTRPWQRI